MCILGVHDYTIPLYGNRHALPYGRLIIQHDDGSLRHHSIHTEHDGRQYISVGRKRYYVQQIGRLYAPVYVFEESKEIVI